jgi:hypothetical protein
MLFQLGKFFDFWKSISQEIRVKSEKKSYSQSFHDFCFGPLDIDQRLLGKKHVRGCPIILMCYNYADRNANLSFDYRKNLTKLERASYEIFATETFKLACFMRHTAHLATNKCQPELRNSKNSQICPRLECLNLF